MPKGIMALLDQWRAPSGLPAEQQREIAADWVRFHEEEYGENGWTEYVEGWTGPHSSPPTYRPVHTRKVGNPLHVWSAYLMCRSAKLPLPDWVLNYLDRVAERLSWRVFDSSGKGRPPRKPAAAVAGDMEMTRRGAGNVFEQYGRTDDIRLAARVQRRIYQGQPITAATESTVIDLTKGRSTVERAWRKYKGKLE